MDIAFGPVPTWSVWFPTQRICGVVLFSPRNQHANGVFETSGNQIISRDLQPSSRFSQFPPCLYGREKGREGKVLTKFISYLLKSIVEYGDLSIISNSFSENVCFQGGSIFFWRAFGLQVLLQRTSEKCCGSGSP